jgi:hypothetical protein
LCALSHKTGVEQKYLGRVLAYNEMAFMLSMALTTMFIGVMANYVTLNVITIALGVAFLVVAVYYKKVISWDI